jgi:hypothetical protein
MLHKLRPLPLAARFATAALLVLGAASPALANPELGKFILGVTCAVVIAPGVCAVAKFLAFRNRLGTKGAIWRVPLVTLIEWLTFLGLISVTTVEPIVPMWTLFVVYPPIGMLINLLLVSDRRQNPVPSAWRRGRPLLALVIGLPLPGIAYALAFLLAYHI